MPSCGACAVWRLRRDVGAESGGERGIADEIAEHPENVGGLGAVVDGRDGLGERLAGAFAGAGGSASASAARPDSSDSRAFWRPRCFSIQRVPMKWATPSLSQAGGDSVSTQPGVREGVGEHAVELHRAWPGGWR